MTYTPIKGGPRPPVPGNSPIEAALDTVLSLVKQVPALATVAAAIQGVIQAVDPNGQKAEERTSYLDALFALGDVMGLTEYAQRDPRVPTPWFNLSRWMVVQLGAPDPVPGAP